MDSTALSLCMDNDLPIYVFNMDDERNIDRIVCGERVGTVVYDDDRRTLLKDFSTTPASAWPSRSRRPGTSSPPCAPAAPRPHLLDRVEVDYYGAHDAAASQLAQIVGAPRRAC